MIRHKSKLTQKLLQRLSYKVFYIPAHSAELAPAEMSISLLKRTLSESNKNENVKLSFRQNLIKIYKSLALNQKLWKKCLQNYFKQRMTILKFKLYLIKSINKIFFSSLANISKVRLDYW